MLSDKEEEYLKSQMGHIKWFLSEETEDMLKETFEKNSFIRAFSVVYNMINDEVWNATAYSVSPSIQDRDNNFYTSFKQKIGDVFWNWFSMFNFQDACVDISREVLCCIMKGTTLGKLEKIDIKYSEEIGFYKGDDPNLKNCLWEINIENPEMVSYKLGSLFSFSYQIVMTDDASIKHLVKSGNTKNQMFSALVSKIMQFGEGTTDFEYYMIENQTGIFTAWKIYSMCLELLLFDTDEGEIFKEILTFSENISKVHNLELRLLVLDSVEGAINEIRKDSEHDIVEAVKEISNTIAELAKHYNEKYDAMCKMLLYLFRHREQWSSALWVKDIKNSRLFSIRQEVKNYRVRLNGSRKTYGQRKFDDLWYADARRKKYMWYTSIRKRIAKGQEWLLMESQ